MWARTARAGCASLGTVMAINGDLDLSGGRSISAGGMQSVWVDVNGAGASSGRLGSVYVGGSVSNSLFEADGLLASLFGQGSFTNSSVQAGSLSVVYVGGTISEDSTDGDTDLIHANAGSYFVIDSTKFSQITSAVSDTFSGVAISVG